MKKTISILMLIFLNFNVCKSQYIVKSNYILDPDLNIDYVKKNVDFWIKYAYDPTYGGFYSSIGRDGTILNNNQKSLISQTRHGYGFTRAFMLTGDEKYLDYAASALKFLFDYGWDDVNGGWYCFAKRDGTIDNDRPWNPNTKKWGFQQQYATLGIVANYEATRDESVKIWLEKGINSLYTNMWDSRPGYEGYFEDATFDWSQKTGKGFTCTVDAISTNIELCYLTTKETKYKDRFKQLADVIVNRFIPTMDNPLVKVSYPGTFSTNWQPDLTTKSSTSSIGHFLKTAWCLGRAYLCDTTQTQYKAAAERILNETWSYQFGNYTLWDHVNGGPFYAINVLTGEGAKDYDNKDYWMLEQGFTGPMLNYYISKNPVYLQMADESINFFMNHLIDNEYGEIFSQMDPTGTIIRNSTKGDDFKASYHSTEMGYYAYLYSNLYYLHKPANLYYRFAPKTTAQSISLTPIPMEDDLLRIKSVTLDGVDFTSFNATTRTLNIAANQGGKFKVTFESIEKTATGLNSFLKNCITISPNPTPGIVRVMNMENVSKITLIDVTGKLFYQTYTNGQNSIQIDIAHLKSGVYFMSLVQKSGAIISKKVIKQ